MFTTILGILSTITSAVGIIAFFNQATVLLCICAVISIVNSLAQVISGSQNNLNTEIATVVIFSITSFFTDSGWLNMIAFGLCVVEVVMTVLGWIMMLFLMKKTR